MYFAHCELLYFKDGCECLKVLVTLRQKYLDPPDTTSKIVVNVKNICTFGYIQRSLAIGSHSV